MCFEFINFCLFSVISENDTSTGYTAEIDTMVNQLVTERKRAKRALAEARLVAERLKQNKKRKAEQIKKRAKKTKWMARDESESDRSINMSTQDGCAMKGDIRYESESECSINTSTQDNRGMKGVDREILMQFEDKASESACDNQEPNMSHEVSTLPDGTTITDLATVDQAQL